ISLYPAHVESLTLAGFFGEAMSGLVAEVFGPHEKVWVVPAFCFRYHDSLFRELLGATIEERAVKRAFGRTGDDCLAFELDKTSGSLTAILVCEAKCSYTHSARLIKEGHEQLSRALLGQLDIGKVRKVLADRNDSLGRLWIDALINFANRK